MDIIKVDIRGAELTVYLHDGEWRNEPKTRDMMLVLPGGGYAGVEYREGEPIALEFMTRSYNTAVLRYSVTPNPFPTALLQAAAAVAYLKDHKEEFKINRIFASGFSAGGHLCASLGTLWHKPFVSEALGRKNEDFRVDGMALAYPVITSGEYAHHNSIKNLLCENYGDIELMELVSLEKQVSEHTVPAFIWATVTDQVVPCENSLMLATALKKNNIPFSLHLYPYGDHGLCTCNKETLPIWDIPATGYEYINDWFNLADRFLDSIKG